MWAHSVSFKSKHMPAEMSEKQFLTSPKAVKKKIHFLHTANDEAWLFVLDCRLLYSV